MKYRLLLLGTNGAAVDDFFNKAELEFELQTSSMHFRDIRSHIKYFKPHAIVYCMHHETRTNITNLITVKHEVASETPFIAIGNLDEIEECKRIAVNVVDFSLSKPLSATQIKEQLLWYLESLSRQSEAEEKNQRGPVRKEAVQKETNEVPLGEDAAKQGTRRVLVVDDDVRMVKVIKSFLEGEYQVASAINGSIALRYLEKHTVDLILLDYEMPDMNGPEVLKKIRASAALASIPVVFLTGASEQDKILKALSLKPQGYLLKPVDSKQLQAKLHEILG